MHKDIRTNLVIIPSHNSSSTIVDTLHSLQAQTCHNWQAVIVDDGSTDNTVEIVKKFQRNDHRIELIIQPNNQGPGVARNVALDIYLEHAKYVFFLDSDDIAHHERISKQQAYLNQHPQCVAVGSWVDLFGAEGGTVKTATAPSEVASLLFYTCEIVMPSMAVRASALRKHGFRFLPKYVHEDWELMTRLARVGEVCNLPLPLTMYRRRQNQLTQSLVNTATDLSARLRASHLEWLGIPKDKIDIETHVAISPCFMNLVRDVPTDAFSVKRIEAWQNTLEEYGRMQNKVDPDVFLKVTRSVFDKAKAHAIN